MFVRRRAHSQSRKDYEEMVMLHKGELELVSEQRRKKLLENFYTKPLKLPAATQHKEGTSAATKGGRSDRGMRKSDFE